MKDEIIIICNSPQAVAEISALFYLNDQCTFNKIHLVATP